MKRVIPPAKLVDAAVAFQIRIWKCVFSPDCDPVIVKLFLVFFSSST
jgi:hypothetical protein